jgi:hypothetical protein
MTIKRSAIWIGIVLGLPALFIIWAANPRHGTPAGGLSVTFAGLTNGATGETLAQFRVTNTFPRCVTFGIGEVQVLQTNNWPEGMRVAGGAAWIPVKAGSDVLFSIPTQSLEELTWRVPLIYSVDLSPMDNVRFRLDGLLWSIPRWRLGKPPPVRHGSPYHRSFFVYGPVMSGLSTVQPSASANGDTITEPDQARKD